tara:strand:+ start:19 stop:231 length:213 start_codon:yes stop_codon:yes gene_type:complete
VGITITITTSSGWKPQSHKMEDLDYWKHVLSERTEDYEFEVERGEDDTLIKLCRDAVEEAKTKIEELENV